MEITSSSSEITQSPFVSEERAENEQILQTEESTDVELKQDGEGDDEGTENTSYTMSDRNPELCQ